MVRFAEFAARALEPSVPLGVSTWFPRVVLAKETGPIWRQTCPEEGMPDGADEGRNPVEDFTITGPAVRPSAIAVRAFQNPPVRVSGHDWLAGRSPVDLQQNVD